MNNKNILRLIFPFFVIFAISLTIAAYTYLQKNLPGARAGDEALSVTLVTTRDPLSTNEEWEWKLVSTVDRVPSQPIALTYTANWCLNPNNNTTCTEGISNDFFYQVGSGNITINTRDTAAKITHQSVNCGRVELEIKRDGQPVSTLVHSTSTECNKDLSASVSDYARSPTEITKLINELLRSIFGLLDEDTDKGDGDSPVVTEPGSPGNPGGQVCSAEGASCQEEYREACGEGEQAGTRVCFKQGTCAGPGSGVQCSWGPNSTCDPCEPGTTIEDPLPPARPPQNPPGNPGGPQPEPLPLPADADAQKAVKLADYLLGSKDVNHADYLLGGCVFTVNGDRVAGMVTQYNVDSCTTGAIGTSNDNQAKAEIRYSAHNLGASQKRGGKVIGYNHLQCVGFVEGAVAAATGNDYVGPTGNATSRCKNAGNFRCIRVGQNFSRISQESPRPNDLAVWETSGSGPFGHIAYVVSSTANSMTVVEANNGCIGCVRRFTYTISEEVANRNFAGFLRKN